MIIVPIILTERIRSVIRGPMTDLTSITPIRMAKMIREPI
jgi:hypothetical protein